MFQSWGIYSPKKVLFGVGEALLLSKEIEILGIRKNSKILLILDPAMKEVEFLNKILNELSQKYEIDIYTDVEPEPSVDCAKRAAQHAIEISPAAIIAIGGGSTIDLAKITRAAMDNPDKGIEEFTGIERIPRVSTSLIALPTTAGTGSEVTRYAVLTKGNIKMSPVSAKLIPDIAVVDPKLTVTAPPRVTAGTGLDVLCHAVEGLISIDATSYSDMIGFRSIELVFGYLRRAFYKGTDIEARYFMSMAATLAGLGPLNTGRTILGHSIGQTFGARYHVHHGISCGMSLPYIMEFYLPVAYKKLAKMAEAAGVRNSNTSDVEAANAMVKATWELVIDLEVSSSLKKIGVPKEELKDMADSTMRDWPRPNSPIELTVDRILEVYEAMYEGKLSRVQ